MAVILLEIGKGILAFVLLCVKITVLYLLYIVLREIGWAVKQKRNKLAQEKKENEKNDV